MVVKSLRTLIEDIRTGQNLEIYLTILLGLVVGVLALLNTISINAVLGATLATLSLVAFEILGTRRLMLRLFGSKTASAEQFFLERLPVSTESDFRAAEEEICITGMSLKRTIPTHFAVFQELLQKGRNIKILLIEPEGSAIELGGHRLIQPLNKERHQSYIYDSKETLKWLHRQPNQQGKLELRFLEYVPPFGLMLVDPDRLEGKIFVEIYNWRMEYGSMPAFELTSYKDGHWYQFFKRQFDVLWANAEPVTLGH